MIYHFDETISDTCNKLETVGEDDRMCNSFFFQAEDGIRDIPVVMISADTDAEKVSQCIELGADDYLPKPFNPSILRARIGAALRRHSLRALENEYVGKIENEKRHSENLLRNILPAEIVTRLRNGER